MSAKHEDEKTDHVPEVSSTQPQCRLTYDDDKIDLVEYWNVIWAARTFIFLFTFGVTLVAVVVVLLLPVTYRSQAVLTATTDNSSSLSKLNGLAGSLPFSLGLPSGDRSVQKLMDFLQSNNLKQRLLKKYDLLPRLYASDWDSVNKKWKNSDLQDQPSIIKAIQDEELKDIYSVSKSKETELITISWVDEDPRFAETMLLNIIAELNHYLNYEYETDAKRERIFVEEQLEKARLELAQWEHQLPTATLTMSVISRELSVVQSIYQELRKQSELAKLQEAKQLVSFKVLDAPFIPEIKFKPKRSLICAFAFVVSGFIAIFIAWTRVSLKQQMDEQHRQNN